MVQAPCLPSNQLSVALDFTIEPYFIYFLLNFEFPDPDLQSLFLFLTIPMAQESVAQAQTMGLSLGTFYITPKKTHLGCSQ